MSFPQEVRITPYLKVSTKNVRVIDVDEILDAVNDRLMLSTVNEIDDPNDDFHLWVPTEKSLEMPDLTQDTAYEITPSIIEQAVSFFQYDYEEEIATIKEFYQAEPETKFGVISEEVE